MKLTFLKAQYKSELNLPTDFKDRIKELFPNSANFGVFSAVQFREQKQEVEGILEEMGYTHETSQPFRTSIQGQILGCDSYKDSLNLDLDEIDGFIYVGDGYFHPNALLLAQEFEEKIKPVIIINCVQEITEVIGYEHIAAYLKKRKVCLAKFYTTEQIGVFITTKWGQEYMDAGLKLKEKYPEKNFYYFIGDNFSDYEMENFPFVECWVNTACPRIGQDDITRHKKAVVNVKDVL